MILDVPVFLQTLEPHGCSFESQKKRIREKIRQLHLRSCFSHTKNWNIELQIA
jgi:hypothetical protein